MRKLPSLNAIRAFECAGRHLSFQRAAEELHVTPSAVSHQVKLLEADLGAPLFVRLVRRVELTAAGRQYLNALSDALDDIDEASRRVRAAHDETVLNLTVAPTFATAWLVPHLLDFQERYPDIEVRLASSLRIPNFRSTDVDLAVLLGPGDWDGLHVERLTREDLVVLCAPSMAEVCAAPGDLVNVPFIRILARPGQWRSWLQANDLANVDPRTRGILVDSTSLAFDAAISGLGVMLADRELAQHHLQAGHLVVPFEAQVETDRGYHLVCPRSHLQRYAAERFVDWLRSQLPA